MRPLYKWLGLSLIFALIALTFKQSVIAVPESTNKLALGKEAKVSGPLYLNYNGPGPLNFLTRQNILNQREACVAKHPELLYYRYTPAASVFDGIEDGKGWWGMNGQLFYGSGERSIEGDAEESRFLFNPFLLVQANIVFEKLSYSQSQFGSMADLAGTDIPLDCAPQSTVYNARLRREEINYDITGFLAKTAQAAHCRQDLRNLEFDIVAYNARDMGFNWISISKTYSSGVSKTFAPIAIDQFIHTGNSCGYPGGCNNMSPYNGKLFALTLSTLPARAVVHLWKNPPAGEANPDFQVLLNFN
ncbi:MAG: hypothetical protein IPP97_18260 [Candidatus Obscuribacter sp.]|nr:hypothetical protein [Candidatus Obscuribacter sp.]MBP6351388.1 hypothetical protein [Candidatus Obscuribacter sp.]MBP6591939.1 hypothetical protein [Candidatus Obscuribacter sp.]MDQ5967110.1 hypothetical protein [Cyanobacteriota bacterium erpe_2018_sw_39hr_WHONDRS-SW48-000098_B_bin.30]